MRGHLWGYSSPWLSNHQTWKLQPSSMANFISSPTFRMFCHLTLLVYVASPMEMYILITLTATLSGMLPQCIKDWTTGDTKRTKEVVEISIYSQPVVSRPVVLLMIRWQWQSESSMSSAHQHKFTLMVPAGSRESMESRTMELGFCLMRSLSMETYTSIHVPFRLLGEHAIRAGLEPYIQQFFGCRLPFHTQFCHKGDRERHIPQGC